MCRVFSKNQEAQTLQSRTGHQQVSWLELDWVAGRKQRRELQTEGPNRGCLKGLRTKMHSESLREEPSHEEEQTEVQICPVLVPYMVALRQRQEPKRIKLEQSKF